MQVSTRGRRKALAWLSSTSRGSSTHSADGGIYDQIIAQIIAKKR